MKTNFKIFLFALLFFILTPLITKAGVWEQSSQADFERGIVTGDLIIADNEIKIPEGIIYENAEDENIDGWDVFTSNPSGEIINIFDPDRSSRVINFLSDDPTNPFNTGYTYGSSLGNSLSTLQWKMKANSTRTAFYLVTTTDLGTRVFHYSPNVVTRQDRIYLRNDLDDVIANNNWHTITRNLTDDLHAFEPDNNITNIRYVAVRGNISVDDIYFLPNINSTYISPVLDLGESKLANFGRIIWEEEVPENTSLTLQSRTSNDSTTWSEWSREYDNSTGEEIDSTPQRYLQYRVNLNNNNNVEAIPKLRKTLIEYNRVPNTTTNLLPANDRRLANTDNLTWNSASDPDPEDSITYTLELDNNSDFTSLDSVTSRIDNTEIAVNQLENFTNLEDDIRYYWRIKTVDSQNNQSNYTSEEKFFILDKENQTPNSPDSGFNPSQGGIVKTQKPTIYWSAASDPDRADSKDKLSYIIQIDENNKFNSANIYTTEANKTNLTLPKNLEDNTHYFYRIKTKDDEDLESIWSETQNFIIATGKNPIISVSKTVGINKDNNDQSNILLGFVNSHFNLTNLEYIYWIIIILIITIAFFFLNKNILFNYILAPSYNKKNYNKKKNNGYLARTIRSMDGVNNTKKVATEVKGSRTKTVIAVIIIIGIIALTFAGIYYYNDNPSPYKDDGKNVQVGDELVYRIDFKNEGRSQASNFNIIDTVPEGTSYIENSTNINGNFQSDTKDDDLVYLDSNKINFEFGIIEEKSSGCVSFKTKVNNVPKNHKIENTANVVFSESDGIQNTNKTINYIEDAPSNISKIDGNVWLDSNNNKTKDENEYGIEDISITLYEDKNNDNYLSEDDNSHIAQAKTDINGNYLLENIIPGNYFIKIDPENISENTSITTNNNPQLIAITEVKEYSDINFGISSSDEIIIEEENNIPKGKISGIVWADNNEDMNKDLGEIGINNVNLKLYEDNNNNNTLEFDQDSHVSLHKTDSNGKYEISGLSPKTYLILIEEKTLPSEEFRLTTPTNPIVAKLENENQEYENANFGYYIEGAIEEEIGSNSTTEEEYNGAPNIITSEDDYNKSDTIGFTPVEVSEEDKQGKIAPPTLTHLGPVEIKDYKNKYSMSTDENLILKGKTGSNFKVTIYIHSQLNLKTVTSANQEGLWEMVVNTKLFEAGEHSVYAQSEDIDGNLSAKVEIAHFNVNKEEKITEQFNYWIALAGLGIIAATIILTTWIKEKGGNKLSKPKNKSKPKKSVKKKTKKTKKKPTKKSTTKAKPKSKRRKIKVK